MTDPSRGPCTFTATSDQADRRLDRVLRGLYPTVPFGAIMRALRKGAVRVDGKRAAIDHRLAEGAVVSVPWSNEQKHHAAPQAAAPQSSLKVIYRDEHVICVDKPAGMLSQPDGSRTASVIEEIWRYLAWTRSDFRPALIGRLDRNVSGVVLAAVDHPTLRSLSDAMRRRSIKKIYVAAVEGSTQDEGAIDASIKRSRSNEVVTGRGGLRALTLYRTLHRSPTASLVELDLVTGRPHQARAHMAHIGHPIVGDSKYGASSRRTSRRIFLHALSISLPHEESLPDQLRGAVFSSPIPDDILRIVKKI